MFVVGCCLSFWCVSRVMCVLFVVLCGVGCWLLVISCKRCGLFGVCCSMFAAVCCLLYSVRCVLFIVCCVIVVVCLLLVVVPRSVFDVWWLWCGVRCLWFVRGRLRLAVSCELLVASCAFGWWLLIVGVCLSCLHVCCFLRAVVIDCGVFEVVALVFYVRCRYCVRCLPVVVCCGVCSQCVVCCCLMCVVCCLL